MSDQFDTWRKLLTEGLDSTGIHENQIESGFYRIKRGQRMVPIAIWRDADGALMVLEDGEAVGDNRRGNIWPQCARYPISKATYDEMLSTTCNDDPVYSKLPRGPEELAHRADMIAAEQRKLSLKSEADAMRMADLLHIARAIEKMVRENVKAEKELFDEQIAEVKARWEPIGKKTSSISSAAKMSLYRWITSERRSYIKGQLGKAVSLRQIEAVSIADYDKALAHFVEANPEAFRPVVEKLARAAKEPVPGTEIKTMETVQ